VRPGCGHTAEQRDELAAPDHSITSRTAGALIELRQIADRP
jgi:hypothetical protein